jgi:glycerophosphoryl diester phosphodiesterase
MTSLSKDFFVRPFAHRGLHDLASGRPENAMSSIKAALAAGYGIETDLQMSSDGVPIVFHDAHLSRLTERSERVSDLTAADLSATELNGGTGGIPTLAEVLEEVDGEVPMLIEIKDQDGTLGSKVGKLEAATAELLKQYSGSAAVMSFNPHSVAAYSKDDPDTPVGLVTDPFLARDWPNVSAARLEHLSKIADFDTVGACFISHKVTDLESQCLKRLIDRNVPIFCWTVKSRTQEDIARQIAANITFEGYRAERQNG